MTVFVRGRVQGVGFRWWTRARALELGLVGHARNTDDGRVEVVAEGDAASLQQLLDLLGEQPSGHRRPGRVESVSTPLWGRPRGSGAFLER
jgi:acylphosphatase